MGDENDELLRLTNGALVDVRVAFAFVRDLRSLLAAAPAQFHALWRIARGEDRGEFPEAESGLRAAGYLAHDGKLHPVLEQVIRCAVKALPSGGVEVSLPHDEQDEREMEKWAKQHLRSRRRLKALFRDLPAGPGDAARAE